jgi:hypothetical protein
MSTLQTAEIPVALASSRRSAEQWSARARRLVGLGVCAACSAVLALAAWITPAPAGHGSHEQLGLPPCGWIAIGDLPCPTCGMTTAFAHAADGHVLAALRVQPLGGLLAVCMAVAWLISIHVVITGSRLGGAFARLWSVRTAWGLSMVVVAAWGYKIALYKGWL